MIDSIKRRALANHISKWIKDYLTKSGQKTLILGLSGGIDSALVALLCKMTGAPLLCVNMPCHSSGSAYARAKAFADEYELNMCTVDLSAAHDSIFSQVKEFKNIPNAKLENPIAVGGLRSCLRAPTLSYFANATSGIIVGTGNRSEDNITRYFQKYGDGCVDISPIADLFKSEVRDLFWFLATYGDMSKSEKSSYQEEEVLGPPIGAAFKDGEPTRAAIAFAEKLGVKVEDLKRVTTKDGEYLAGTRKYRELCDSKTPKSAQDILDARPTADLWGPDSEQEDEKELGISYDEIEWADREDMRTQATKLETHGGPSRLAESVPTPGIIFSDEDPAKRPDFFRYTGRQQQVIAKLHQMEKASRHKMNPNLPVCKVRHLTDMIS